MLETLKKTGKRFWQLVLPAASTLVSLNFGEVVAQARTNWTLALHEQPPPWLTEEFLAPRIQPLLVVVTFGSVAWVLWPIVWGVVGWLWRFLLPLFQPAKVTPASALSGYGVASLGNRDGGFIVGGRAEDEPGVTIGLMPTAEALRAMRTAAEPEREFIPLKDAGQWLYDNGAAWLRDRLKDPEPFDSITEHAAAYVGEACDAGVGELVASRELGLRPEPVKYRDLRHSGFDALFGGKPLPVNPMVREADLPSILAYYENPSRPA